MSSGPSATDGANGPPGDMTRDYESLQVIGKGSFGTVYKATRQSDRAQVVVKEVIITSLNEAERRCALQEASTLSKLQHENIIQYHETRSAEEKLFIVMEFAAGGDLSTAIKRRAQQQKFYSEDQIMLLFVQICLALWHVHSHNFMHRDLKSQNIFLCDNNVAKLGDFGIARSFKHTQDMASTAVGTPYYLSPEICEDKPYNSMSDVWGLGCILYEMATLKRAFEGNSLPALVTKILRGKFSPIPSRYSVHLRSLIHSMLARNPNRRPTVEAILNLPWMRRHLDRYAAHMHQISRPLAAFPTEGTHEAARAASSKHVSMLRSQPSNAIKARMTSVSLDRETASSQQRRAQAQVKDLPVPSKRSSKSSQYSLPRQLVPRLQCKQSEAMARYHPQSGRGASASPIPSLRTPPASATNKKPERPPWQAPTARVKHRTADSLSTNRIKLLDRSPAVGSRAARVFVDSRMQPCRQREDSAVPNSRRPVRSYTQPPAGPARWPRQPLPVGPANREAAKDTKPPPVCKIQSLDRFQPSPVRAIQTRTCASPEVGRHIQQPVYLHPKRSSSSSNSAHQQEEPGIQQRGLRHQPSTIPAGKAAEQLPEEDDDLHSLSSLSSISSYPVLAEPVPGDLGPVASSFWVPPPIMGPPSGPSSMSRDSALLPPVPALFSEMEQPTAAGRQRPTTPEPVRRPRVAPELTCLAEDAAKHEASATEKQAGSMHEQCKKPRTAHAQARDARKAESNASGHRLVSTTWLAGNFAALDEMQDNLCTASVPSFMADAPAAADCVLKQPRAPEGFASKDDIVSHAICPETHHLSTVDSDSDGKAPGITGVPSLNLISQEPSETGNRQTVDDDMSEVAQLASPPRAFGEGNRDHRNVGNRDNQDMQYDDGFDDIMLPQGPTQCPLRQPQQAKCPSPSKPSPRKPMSNSSSVTAPVRRISSLTRRPQRQTPEKQVPTNYRSKVRPTNPQQRAAARQQAQESQQAHRSALQRIRPRLCREELKRAGKDFAARVHEVKQPNSFSSEAEACPPPKPQHEAFIIPLTPRSQRKNKQFTDAEKAEGCERSSRKSPVAQRPQRRLWIAPRQDGNDSALEMSCDWKGGSASAWSGIASPIQVSGVEEGQKPWRQNSNVRCSPQKVREPVVEIYVPASAARLGSAQDQPGAQRPFEKMQSEVHTPREDEGITPGTEGGEAIEHAALSSARGAGAAAPLPLALAHESSETNCHQYSTHNTPSEIFDSAQQDAFQPRTDKHEGLSGHEHDKTHAQHEARVHDHGCCIREVPSRDGDPSASAAQESHSAGPVNKISELRSSLQARLGPERFQAAYCVVRKHQCEKTFDGQAERAAQAELHALLSPDTHLAYSMYRLLTLEEMMHGN